MSLKGQEHLISKKKGAGTDDIKTIGDAIQQLRALYTQPKELGRKFEVLVKQTLPLLAEYEISEVWDFADWPDRDKLTQRSAKDLGIDEQLVADWRQRLSMEPTISGKDSTNE